jgi:hypothetical protein
MTTIEFPGTVTDQRARWRSDVGLDCPSPTANPRRIRYNGGAQISWQATADDPRARR